MHENPADDRITFAAILMSATCVAYFYLLDRSVVSSAQFSPIFRMLLTVYDARTAWISFAVCLVAAFWTRPDLLSRLAELAGRHPRTFGVLAVTASVAGSSLIYENYPLSMDEYAALFQAKIFASGELYARLPNHLVDWLVVRSFNGPFLVASSTTGKVIEEYWPGFALLLSPFEWIHVPSLCNACLTGASVYLIHSICLSITSDRQAAGWAMIFSVSSGAFAADAISFYSMQAHLTANLLFVALLINPSRWSAFGAGVVGSFALNLHNPVPHALFALPWIVAFSTEPDWRRYLLPLIVGYVPGLIAGCAWVAFRSEIAAAGHGVDVGSLASGVFAWPDVGMINMRVAALVKMWLWAVPSIFVLAAVGRFRYRENRHVRLLAQSAIATFIGYLFVRFDQGHGWGYRYFHSAWGAIPILAGCAVAQRSGDRVRLIAFSGAVALLNLICVLPLQMSQIHDFIKVHRAQLPQSLKPGNNVYFIHPKGGFYVADMVQTDPLLRQRDLYLVSHGAALDTALIHQNWPSAIEVGAVAASEHWYLGDDDQRRADVGRKGEKHFVFVHESQR